MPRKTRVIVTADKAPTTWTGDAMLDRWLRGAGFSVGDLKRSLAAYRDGLSAVTGRGPDHAIRLKAAENLFDLVGFSGKRERDARPDPDKITQIHVHLHAGSGSTNGHAGNGRAPRPALPPGRVRVHLEGHNGGTEV